MDKYADYIIKGHKHYWNMLGNMRGNTNHHGELCWLSGDVYYNYFANFDVLDYKSKVKEVVKKIEAKEIPNNLIITPDSAAANVDICGLFQSNVNFTLETNYGMAKDLYPDMSFDLPPKNINIFRVNDVTSLKITGTILNSAFAYDIFSFEHYLDAYNTSYVKFYLAEYNGLPAGACMSLLGDEFVEIAWVGTLNGYRKKGLAGHLIQMAEKDAVEKGKMVSVLSAYPNAVNAYSRIGYNHHCDIKVLSYNFDK